MSQRHSLSHAWKTFGVGLLVAQVGVTLFVQKVLLKPAPATTFSAKQRALEDKYKKFQNMSPIGLNGEPNEPSYFKLLKKQ